MIANGPESRRSETDPEPGHNTGLALLDSHRTMPTMRPVGHWNLCSWGGLLDWRESQVRPEDPKALLNISLGSVEALRPKRRVEGIFSSVKARAGPGAQIHIPAYPEQFRRNRPGRKEWA